MLRSKILSYQPNSILAQNVILPTKSYPWTLFRSKILSYQPNNILAKELEPGAAPIKVLCGTPEFVAPEVAFQIIKKKL